MQLHFIVAAVKVELRFSGEVITEVFRVISIAYGRVDTSIMNMSKCLLKGLFETEQLTKFYPLSNPLELSSFLNWKLPNRAAKTSAYRKIKKCH